MWPPVKESPGDCEQRPVLLGLRDGWRGLQQPRPGGRARQRGLLRVHTLLDLLSLLRQTWTIKVRLFALKKDFVQGNKFRQEVTNLDSLN